MMKTIFGLALVFFSFASGCAVNAKLPLTRHESPETQGKVDGSFHSEHFAAWQARNEVEFTPDLTLRSPSVTDPSVRTPNHRIMAQSALGIADRFDISLNLPSLRLGLKYQILGEPRSRAEAGNFSLAVSGGGTIAKQEETKGSALLSSSSQFVELKETLADISLIAGYRISKEVLFYGGPFSVWDFVRLRYRSDAVAGERTSNGTIRSLGFNLGLQAQFGATTFLRLEGAGSKTRLGRANVGRGSYGFTFGFYL
jgi:hypothetical protein